MESCNRITIDANQCGGRPCIRGTRFRVVDLLELLAAGASHAEILADYAFLEAADIPASPPLRDAIDGSLRGAGRMRFLVD